MNAAAKLIGVLGAALVLTVVPQQTVRANSEDMSAMCEWMDYDFFSPNEYAHSRECSAKPPQGEQEDWQVNAFGHWTNAHTEWVYTRIADETGDSHEHLES
jgi:hypothetical protein